MLGSQVPADHGTVEKFFDACRSFDLEIREAVALGDRRSDHPEAGTSIMGCVRLLPGARGLVTLARICRGGVQAAQRGESPASHERDAAALLTHSLPIATWHAIARCISLAVREPDQEAACLKAMWGDLRPRLHRTIACAAVADPDAAVALMFATAALTLMWARGLHRHGGSPSMIESVSHLVVDLELLHVLDGIAVSDRGGGYAESILYSARRRQGAVVHDRLGIARREQDALRDLADCAHRHGGRIEAMRQALPEHRYTFARLLLRQGWSHGREIARSTAARHRHRPEGRSGVRQG